MVFCNDDFLFKVKLKIFVDHGSQAESLIVGYCGLNGALLQMTARPHVTGGSRRNWFVKGPNVGKNHNICHFFVNV
jgi:hypothetical protein